MKHSPSTKRAEAEVGGWCIVGNGKGHLVFRYAKPFRTTWRHRMWRVIHKAQDFGRRVVRAAWAGVPWLRTWKAGASDSVQGTGGDRETSAGFHTAGENPVAVHPRKRK